MLHWADTKELLWEEFNLTGDERQDPKSVTFIMSTLYDNKILMQKNPGYLANLKALAVVERERLLHGNWKIRPAAGLYFLRTQVGDMLEKIPGDIIRWVRAWDLAATTEEESENAAFTASVLMGERKGGRYIVADVINVRKSANEVRQLVKMTAQMDKARYKRVRIRMAQDPGQAGKDQAQSYIKFLSGFDVTAVPESGSKETRAEPMAAQWQAGNFDVLIADWNEMYFNQLENFPTSKYMDMVDAGSGAFAEIELRKLFDPRNLIT
jgi:predicted phage terminase large subunit-like protein